MSKFADFFYIFSKFATSLVLFILLIFTAYALYKSYAGVDNISLEFDDRLNVISNEIKKNSTKIFDYENSINENKNFLKEIKKNILQKNYEEKILSLEDQNKLLLKQIAKINDSLSKLKITENTNLNTNSNNLKNNNKQILSLKEMILLKYKEGRDVKREIEMLENFALKTPLNIFEKLYLIQSKNFYGKEKLIVEFNLSLEKYVKHKFIIKNQNSVIGFLFKYINIKPNNLSIYENADLNILIRAKKNLEIEEYENSLNQVMSLNDDSTNFFETWVSQIRMLIDLNKYLSKVS